MTTDLCYSFQEIASWVWENIDRADRMGLAFSEETITETMLLKLAMRHPTEVRIKAFSKREEGVNGSDWEWWVGERGNWFGMRVQAKRIKLPAETFDRLQSYGRKDGSTVGQIDRLISRAREDKLNAAYCLYFISRRWPTLRAWPVYAFVGGGPISPQGCLIADASAVKAIAKDSLDDLAPVSVPWHLMVCRCAAGKMNSRSSAHASREVLGSSRQLASSLLRRDHVSDIPNFEPRSELPRYMKFLREDPESDRSADFDPLRERARERGLKGFVLIDGSEGR